MLNLVEMCTEDSHKSPCKHGNIVDGHACYCHLPDFRAPRKCPVWSNYGEEAEKWHRDGDFDSAEWDGGCEYFEERA